MTGIETAKAIRKALKAKGWNARSVSVRHRYATHDSAIDVTIRDAAVSKAEVEAIALPFKSIDRCSASGEILSGGNCYVDVAYAPEAIAPVKAEIMSQLSDEPGRVVEVRGYRAHRDTSDGSYWRWDGPGLPYEQICYGKDYTAERMAEAVLS